MRELGKKPRVCPSRRDPAKHVECPSTGNTLLTREAVIKEITWETPDVFSLRLLLADARKMLFHPGQFTMLGLPGVGEAPISFSSLSLEDNTFVHTIRLAGNVTTALSRLKPKDAVQLRGAFGLGWPMKKLAGRNVIICAGGIGIAPLRPVIHYLQQNRQAAKRLLVLYGVKREEEVLFKKEFREWHDSADLVSLLACEQLSRRDPSLAMQQGFVTALLDKVDVPLAESITLTCGPSKMMSAVARHLVQSGQRPEDIFVSLHTRMQCGTGHCGHCQVGPKFVCKDGPVFAYNEIMDALDTPV